MKHKVSELKGPLLDAAVAAALGWPLLEGDADPAGPLAKLSPSTNWSIGGPIIEREQISLIRQTVDWCADMRGVECHFAGTPLVAAMRCYVASKFGDGVELP